jgi:putative ribosome biogenesis GTPase RsgA
MILINPKNENSEERKREREAVDMQTVSSASKILSEKLSNILTNLLVIFLCVSGLRKCSFIRHLKQSHECDPHTVSMLGLL